MRFLTFTAIATALALCNPIHAQTYRSLGTAYEPIASIAIPVTTTPVQSDMTYVSSSELYRFVADTDVLISLGTSPTATISSSIFLPAFAVEVWPVTDNYKISVRAKSAPGTLYVDKLKK